MAKLKTSSLTFLNSSEQGTHGRRTSRPNIYVAGGFARGVAKVRLSLGGTRVPGNLPCGCKQNEARDAGLEPMGG